MIDPGHGGHDPGAVGYGAKESVLAIQIAQKLKKKLDEHNIVTYLTRDTDDFIELSTRAKKANALKCDLFLSIHINSAANQEASGVEALYYDKKDLASQMSASISDKTGSINRGAKERKDLCVLRETSMPAVLVECGFISNKCENTLLRSEAYQDKIVEAIVETIVKKYKISVKTYDNDTYLDDLMIVSKKIGIDFNYWSLSIANNNISVNNVKALISKIAKYIKKVEG